MISLDVNRDGDCLILGQFEKRYDSINTLVMNHANSVFPVLIGDHEVLASFRYPVLSSKYYK